MSYIDCVRCGSNVFDHRAMDDGTFLCPPCYERYLEDKVLGLEREGGVLVKALREIEEYAGLYKQAGVREIAEIARQALGKIKGE